ncbi:MAG: cation:proton antiporter [Pararhizobium sp.]
MPASGKGSLNSRGSEIAIPIFDLIALLITLSAGFAWLNSGLLRLPQSVGLLTMGLVVSLLAALADWLLPQLKLADTLTKTLARINFREVVLDGMLGFLLFASALGVNLGRLRERAWQVAFLAFFGTLISTALVGTAFWAVSHWIGYGIALPWALVFGALISPTDPVAVLAALKSVSLPKVLEVELQGESLFNDGAGIALFTVLLGFAAPDRHNPGAADILLTFLRQAGGGLALGAVTGYAAYLALRAIDEFSVEIMITLALVTATYAIAERLGCSGPLSVVAAGLIVGSRGRRYAMSELTQRYVNGVWTVIDDILNAILFTLMGLEVVILRNANYSVALALAAVPIVLVVRLIALSLPVVFVPAIRPMAARNIPFLTWAGIRGGVSIALVLSLPNEPGKPTMLAATYAVVIFSVLVQGLTLGRFAKLTVARRDTEMEEAAEAEEAAG